MEYTLKDFEGAYSCIPNVISGLASPESYLLFSLIYAYGCRVFSTALVDNEISISIRNLQKMTGLGLIKLSHATKELEDLNFIKVCGSDRQKHSYRINWDEIYEAHKIMSSLSYDGIAEIRKQCKAGKDVIALSKLAPERISKIIEDFQYNWSASVLKNNKTAKINTDSNTDMQSVLKIKENTQFNTLEIDENDKSVLKNNKTAKINTDFNVVGMYYGHKFTEETDGSLCLNVNVGESECVLAKHTNISKVKLYCFSGNCIDFPENCIDFPENCIDFHGKASKSTEIQYTVNIVNIKENELGERSEPSNIGGEKQKPEKVEEKIEDENFYEGKDFFEDFEKEENFERQGKDKNFLDKDEKDNLDEKGKVFYEGLEIPEKFEDPISESEYYRRDKARLQAKSNKLNNPFLNKPYFSERDMKRITSLEGLQEEGVKHPVQLFYFNFWDSLYEWYLAEHEEDLPADEHGEEEEEPDEPSDLSMLRTFVPAETMFQLISHAWQDTEDNIKAGFIEREDFKATIEVKDIPDINPMFLIDWRTTKDINKQDVFVISLEGFRNIEAKDASEVKKPRTKEEVKAFNRKNRQFLATVVNMDDSQLTPMERAVKVFAKDFLRVDEYYHVEGFMNGKGLPMMVNVLPAYILKPWALKMSNELEVTQDDFYKTLNQTGGYKDGANLGFAATTFDYQEVKRWNELNGFQSKINEESLESALLSA